MKNAVESTIAPQKLLTQKVSELQFENLLWTKNIQRLKKKGNRRHFAKKTDKPVLFFAERKTFRIFFSYLRKQTDIVSLDRADARRANGPSIKI